MIWYQTLEDVLDIDALRAAVSREAPQLSDRLHTYLMEAAFAVELFAADLQRMSRGSTIVEIGSGAGLFAHWLAAQGFSVIAVEPAAAGFSAMHTLRVFVQRYAPAGQITWVDAPGEIANWPTIESVHLAVSFNVLEHVGSVGGVLENVMSRLHPRGEFHFVCPNYDFPYEPHFNTWTLFSKQLTQRFRRGLIEKSNMEDAECLWANLSWPSVRTIRRLVRQHPTWTASFSSRATQMYLHRLQDSAFLERKGLAFRLLRPFARVLYLVMGSLPRAVLPVIDGRVTKSELTL